MKHENLKKAVEKFAKVTEYQHGASPGYMAECNGMVITWFTAFYTRDEASCVNVRHVNDKHDFQSDYHGGCYYDTIKSAIRALTCYLDKREEI